MSALQIPDEICARRLFCVCCWERRAAEAAGERLPCTAAAALLLRGRGRETKGGAERRCVVAVANVPRRERQRKEKE